MDPDFTTQIVFGTIATILTVLGILAAYRNRVGTSFNNYVLPPDCQQWYTK